ncbi:MAG: M23 family metallopeptidase [Bacteroidetes bacterium]|nr:M23 family metallopeptidase [Bacteroidota bacterium]
MNRLEKLLNSLKEEIKISSSNPSSFEEKWSFTSTRMRVISLIMLIVIIIGTLFSLFVFKGPFASYFTKNDKSIGRTELEKQEIAIQSLNEKLKMQDTFIANLQKVILGEIKPDDVKKKKNLNPVDIKGLSSASTDNEEELREKVKEDMRTGAKPQKNEKLVLYQRPISGYISQNYDAIEHPAIDIVSKKDEIVKACASGVIIYSGFSKEDGFFLIIDHGNESQSIYKHNKVNLKKSGQRVQVGDPIAIVGNTGENSSGPHLHFELWFQQKQINPTDLISF